MSGHEELIEEARKISVAAGFRSDALQTGLQVLIIQIAFFRTPYGYGSWIEAWEGCVVRKYTYIDYIYDDDSGYDKVTRYAVDLTTGHKKHLVPSEWNRVKVGDYIVKKSRSYTIKIRPKP